MSKGERPVKFINAMYLDVKSSAIKRIDARAVVALGDDAGQVHDQRIEKHDPDHKRRREQPEHPKWQNTEPVDQLPARGFDQKPVQIFRGIVRQILLLVAAFLKRAAAVRQKVFPSADMEDALIETPVLLKPVRAPEKARRFKVTIGNQQAKIRQQQRHDRPNGKEQEYGHRCAEKE